MLHPVKYLSKTNQKTRLHQQQNLTSKQSPRPNRYPLQKKKTKITLLLFSPTTKCLSFEILN